MVDRGRHLGAVPDSEIREENKGLVTVRTADVWQLSRWLNKPPSVKEVPLAPFDLAEFTKPACGITGNVEQMEEATIITSRIKPTDNRQRLPDPATLRPALEPRLSTYSALWIPMHKNYADITFYGNLKSPSLSIARASYLLISRLKDIDGRELPDGFNNHAKILEHVVEALLSLQNSDLHPKKPLELVLRPLLGNGAGPQPTRAA